MNNIYILIFIVIITLIIIYKNYIKIYVSDLVYLFNHYFINKKKINDNLTINNVNKINEINKSDNKIIILSFDNRTNINYIEDHNKNIENYCKKWKNVEYQFSYYTNKNPYWNKLYLVLEKLLTNNYNYVMWMDTDSMFVNQDIDITNILLLFNSDIFIGHDNDYNNCENVLNAGVFIIKNSINGINFLKEAIAYFEDSKCLNDDNTLKGLYAARCYEQGTINDLIYSKYYKYTTILSTNVIFNTYYCNENDKSFILHNYGGDKYGVASESNKLIDIKSCFNKINSKF
jgi:hypothetical protein